MIYISFVEIFRDAQDILIGQLGDTHGMVTAVLSFFGGILLIAVIDKLIPSFENPHEIRSVEKMNAPVPETAKMMRVGFMTAVAIAIHNFPEGIATFTAAMDNTSGLSLKSLQANTRGESSGQCLIWRTPTRRPSVWRKPTSQLSVAPSRCFSPMIQRSFTTSP